MLMSFLAWMAYFWPGSGSSEVILQMAAWASVKIVAVPILCCPARSAAVLAP